MQSDREREFHIAMVNIYHSAKRDCFPYEPRIFIQMVSEKGALQTAKDLLRSDEIQYGFDKLWECGRLDLTVEAHVLKPEFRELFTGAELRRAHERLEDLGYQRE